MAFLRKRLTFSRLDLVNMTITEAVSVLDACPLNKIKTLFFLNFFIPVVSRPSLSFLISFPVAYGANSCSANPRLWTDALRFLFPVTNMADDNNAAVYACMHVRRHTETLVAFISVKRQIGHQSRAVAARMFGK